MQLGIRYLLPIMPFVMLFAGQAARSIAQAAAEIVEHTFRTRE